MPLAAVAGIGAATSLIGGAISSNAAGNAASEQSQAAQQAAQLQYQASQNALGFQEQQYNTGQQQLQPFLQSGTGALSNLDYLMGVNPQSASAVSPSTSSVNSTIPQASSPSQSVALPGQTMPTSTARQSGAVSGVSLPNATPATTAAGTPVPGNTLPTSTTPATPFTATPSSASPGGYGSLLQPYGQTFTAPTAQQALNSPGEQAQLQLGQQAMEQSAAARGNVLTGGTAQAENQLAQNYASTNYQNTYNNAYNTYAAGYNQYQNQQSNEFNRLSALAGGGQTAANTLGSLGASTANSVSNNVLGTASQMGQDTQNAAAANASGIVGSANAYSGALGGIGSNLTQLALLNQLYGGGASSIPTLNTGGGMGITGGIDYGAPSVDTAGLSNYASSFGMGGY